MCKNYKKLFYVLAFIIPVMLTVIVYASVNIYPFGDKTILFRDLDGQYINYFAAFRNSILGDGGIIYSFIKGLGGDMLGLIAYYLMSPLNLIILIFPLDKITEAVEIITLAKIGLCGLTFSILLSKINKSSKWSMLLFSTSYAMMSFNFVYQTNIMWLDGVYILPIVILGVINIIDNRKYIIYTIALTFAIVTNFYIGFIICIFVTLYFIYYLVSKYLKNKEIKLLDRIKLFVGSSIISGLLSMIVLIPTVIALSGGKARFEFFTTSFSTNFKFWDILSKLYINGVIHNDVINSMPNIYCGTFITVLTLLYFLNKNIDKEDKIGGIFIIFAILISFYINKLDLIWHGFNKPVGFPYRYSFVFSFFIITLAYKSFENIKYINKKCFLLILALICITSYSFLGKHISYLSNKQVILTTCFAVFYIIILYLKQGNDKNKILLTVILALSIFVELGINAFSILRHIHFKSRTEFVTYLNNTKEVVDYIKDKDSSFYRMEKTFANSKNDSMLMDYNSVSHFSSMFKVEVRDALTSLGLDTCRVWYRYDSGSTPITDNLLGVKYILTKNKNIGEYNKYYKKIYEINDISVYENKYAMPIAGTMVSDKILNLNTQGNLNTFNVQSKIINSMVDKNISYFSKPNNILESTINLTKEKYEGGYIYTRKKKDEDAYIEFSFKNLNNEFLYMYIPGLNKRGGASVSVNGKKVNEYRYYNYKVLHLGKFKIGENVKIKIKLNHNKFFMKDSYIYYFNFYEINKVFNQLKKNEFSMKKISDTDIKGEVVSSRENNVLYTTIPYSDEWKAYIDGKQVQTEKILGAFMGIKVPTGKHIIEFKYVSKGLIIGSTITATTILGLLIFYLLKRNKKKLDQ